MSAIDEALSGREELMEDHLMGLLESLEKHSYGERLDMLAHSLQTAAAAEADDAPNSLVLAALLHDIGHLIGEATEWGLPSHAEVGAQFLQRWFSDDVVTPIRLHVDAKRYLTATDPTYARQLSEASTQTLIQQGGPFSAEAAGAFALEPGAEAAVRLRRWDDGGKVTDAPITDLEHYRPLISQALASDSVSPLWARDACRCPECRDPENGQHLIGADELVGWNLVGQARTVDGMFVDLERCDGTTHRCLISSDNISTLSTPPVLWGSSHELRPTGGDVHEFASQVASHGIALIGDIPTTPGQVLEFARTVGFVRETNYGALFDVVAEEAPINLAFTSTGLPLHTDNPYRDPVPTVQLLHCLRSAEAGGGSLFVDGFHAAEQLRLQDPGAFDLLTSTPVRFEFSGPGVHLTAVVPMIRLDHRGSVNRVTVNNRSMQPVDIGADTTEFYEAYVCLAEVLADPANAISISLEPGELIGFDNRRVLHGRSSFAGGGARHLQGCYIDIDALRSAAAIADSASWG